MVDLQSFFSLFFTFLHNVFDTVFGVEVSAFGVTVSLKVILFTFLIVGFVIFAFWKGARA